MAEFWFVGCGKRRVNVAMNELPRLQRNGANDLRDNLADSKSQPNRMMAVRDQAATMPLGFVALGQGVKHINMAVYEKYRQDETRWLELKSTSSTNKTDRLDLVLTFCAEQMREDESESLP